MGRGKSRGFRNKRAGFRSSSCTDQLCARLCRLCFPNCKLGMVLPAPREDRSLQSAVQSRGIVIVVWGCWGCGSYPTEEFLLTNIEISGQLALRDMAQRGRSFLEEWEPCSEGSGFGGPGLIPVSSGPKLSEKQERHEKDNDSRWKTIWKGQTTTTFCGLLLRTTAWGHCGTM